MRTIKKLSENLLIIAVVFALTAAMLFGAFSLYAFRSARAASDTTEFETASLELANTDFSESSGSFPSTPTSWTGAHIDGSGNVKAGVVDLSPKAYVAEGSGNETFKLDQYPEYSTKDKIPSTVFGEKGDFEGSDEKALLINTVAGAEVSYAFTSADMTFARNSFYRISAWVKTGDFASGRGATVKLSGLGAFCGFENINTVSSIAKNADNIPDLNKDNNFGWAKYTLYVRTSPSLESTVNLMLGVGDAATDSKEDGPAARAAKGYAFFDHIVAERISSKEFAHNTMSFTPDGDNRYVSADGKSLAMDFYNTETLTVGNELGSFSQNFEDWDKNPKYDPDAESSVSRGVSRLQTYNSYQKQEDLESNEYGLTQNPWAPFGKAEDTESPAFNGGTNGNILFISSTFNQTQKSFGLGAAGVASPDVTIERFNYYRLGVWVKTDSLTGGSGASLGVVGQSAIAEDDNKINKRYTNLTGDEEDKAHYGWKETVVYIKGSVYKDCAVHFELWMGSPASQSSGIAMFDNLTFTKLSYSDYKAMSEADGGETLSLDPEEESTGIANGTFQSVGDYEDFEYPLPPAEWEYYTASNVNSIGFSSKSVNSEKAIHGIIPSDRKTFDEVYASGKLYGVKNPALFATPATGNLLLLSSVENTAICYRSPAFTVATDKANKITVELAVSDINGYGANLVLKKDSGEVVSTIERITDTANNFKTYTFYIDAPLSDQSLRLEVWLGLNDRKNNTQKLSKGSVYVKKAAMTEWTVESDGNSSDTDDSLEKINTEYRKMLNAYIADSSNPNKLNNLDYNVYSFKSPVLDYYDAYTYNNFGGFGKAYGWNVTSANSNTVNGIFNTDNMRSLTVYDGFDKKDYTDNMLYINNTEKNTTTYTYAETLNLVASSYYRLDVVLKVRLDSESKNSSSAVGANIEITGKKQAKFENIKDTSTLVAQNNEESRDNETFKTYTFFISTGSDGGEFGLKISLGGSSADGYVKGQLIVADIKFESINNTAFDTAKENLKEGYQQAIEFSESQEDEPDDEEKPQSDIAWWVIPTVIFSAALLIAVIVIIIIRLRDKFKKKKTVTYTSEYDRTAALQKLEGLEKANADKAEKEEADGTSENEQKEDEQKSENPDEQSAE